MNLRQISLFLVVLFGTSVFAMAHVSTLDIHVLSFSPSKDADYYTIIFDAVTTDYGKLTNLPAKKRRFEVHFHGKPEEALRILRERIALNPNITVGRMSDKGWQPVAGKRGVFESIGLGIHRPAENPSDHAAIIYFLHDSRY